MTRRKRSFLQENEDTTLYSPGHPVFPLKFIMDRLGYDPSFMQRLTVSCKQDQSDPDLHAFLLLLLPEKYLMAFDFHDFLYGFPMDLIVAIFVLIAV